MIRRGAIPGQGVREPQSQGDFSKAITYHAQRLAIAKEVGDRAGEGSAYKGGGRPGGGGRGVRGPWERAPAAGGLFQGDQVPHAVPGDCQGGGRQDGEGGAHRGLGIAHDSLGDFSQTIKYHTQYQAIAKEVGDRAGEGGAYANLGTCHMHLIEYDKAVACFKAQHASGMSLKLGTRAVPAQRSTWVSPSPFTSGQLARALPLALTKPLDRTVTRRHRRA